jgi:hypothetical protein
VLEYFVSMQGLAKAAAPHAEEILESPEARRRSTQEITTNFEHIPKELLVHVLRGAANSSGALSLIDFARRYGYTLDAEQITCPVRFLWEQQTGFFPCRRLQFATARTGCRRPSGSSSTASAIVRNSTSRLRRRS